MIVKPSIAFNDFAGSAKGVTARNVKGRNILSSKAQHSNSVIPAQAVSRNRLSSISRSYKKLTDLQMSAWDRLAWISPKMIIFTGLQVSIPFKVGKSDIMTSSKPRAFHHISIMAIRSSRTGIIHTEVITSLSHTVSELIRRKRERR